MGVLVRPAPWILLRLTWHALRSSVGSVSDVWEQHQIAREWWQRHLQP